jgi:AcrR family transcriptional regulator
MPEKPASHTGGVSRRGRILDAAEELFAEHGYDGVALRKIAAVAGVDVALASYHFGRKLDVFNAVFERRADFLNESRHRVPLKVQRTSGPGGTGVEQIIETYQHPLELAHELRNRRRQCRCESEVYKVSGPD